MRKIIFNEHQIRQLELNPNVASVSDHAIQYTGDFKVQRKIPYEKIGYRRLYIPHRITHEPKTHQSSPSSDI